MPGKNFKNDGNHLQRLGSIFSVFFRLNLSRVKLGFRGF